MMLNIGTLIVCCLGSLAMGFEIAWFHYTKEFNRHLDDLFKFYDQNTRSLARSILSRLDEYDKGGE